MCEQVCYLVYLKELKCYVNYLFQLVVDMRNGEMWITKKLQKDFKD